MMVIIWDGHTNITCTDTHTDIQNKDHVQNYEHDACVHKGSVLSVKGENTGSVPSGVIKYLEIECASKKGHGDPEIFVCKTFLLIKLDFLASIIYLNHGRSTKQAMNY